MSPTWPTTPIPTPASPSSTAEPTETNIGGTSAGAPQWAALLALADQGRAALGYDTLTSEQALTMMYATLNNPALYAQVFHDVTTGANSTGQAAGLDYDYVTGLGSPDAQYLIAYLVPEPTTLALMGITLIPLLAGRRVRRAKR